MNDARTDGTQEPQDPTAYPDHRFDGSTATAVADPPATPSSEVTTGSESAPRAGLGDRIRSAPRGAKVAVGSAALVVALAGMGVGGFAIGRGTAPDGGTGGQQGPGGQFDPGQRGGPDGDGGFGPGGQGAPDGTMPDQGSLPDQAPDQGTEDGADTGTGTDDGVTNSSWTWYVVPSSGTTAA